MKHSLCMAVAVLTCLVTLPTSAKEQGAGNHLVLNLVGSGDMYQSTVPDIDGDGLDDDAICFDVQLMDAHNRRHIGTATDCLSHVTPVGTGVALVGTTYFHLPQGTLVTRGNTSVQPTLQNTMTPSGQAVTHVTGAAGTGNAILWGTGRFAGAMGTVRLSGMVDMTSFAGNPGDPIAFDCLFVIDLY
ncbi:hypothetical protein [Ferrimonas futtsuensis]|uniref:hypothetical protein n=1 Tax=Ferrimonas futtsuensis TaxID=364764 RepID=UPI0003F6D197|nr:hypothetical protein [Ferrimonas futtsuensis]